MLQIEPSSQPMAYGYILEAWQKPPLILCHGPITEMKMWVSRIGNEGEQMQSLIPKRGFESPMGVKQGHPYSSWLGEGSRWQMPWSINVCPAIGWAMSSQTHADSCESQTESDFPWEQCPLKV